MTLGAELHGFFVGHAPSPNSAGKGPNHIFPTLVIICSQPNTESPVYMAEISRGGKPDTRKQVSQLTLKSSFIQSGSFVPSPVLNFVLMHTKSHYVTYLPNTPLSVHIHNPTPSLYAPMYHMVGNQTPERKVEKSVIRCVVN